MDTLEQIANANRLAAITERIGFAVWQLQHLEGSAAVYLALVVHAKPGMGAAAGQKILDKLQTRTFGTTVGSLIKAAQLPLELRERFEKIVESRNWLIHRSGLSNRNAVHNDRACGELIARVNALATESKLLHEELRKLAEAFGLKHGISPQEVNERSRRLIMEWRKGGGM